MTHVPILEIANVVQQNKSIIFSESNINKEMERFFHMTKEQFQVLLKTLSQELVEQ